MIVESVGLGQSEVEIDNAVDMLIMIVPPGGGDGLQVSSLTIYITVEHCQSQPLTGRDLHSLQSLRCIQLSNRKDREREG